MGITLSECFKTIFLVFIISSIMGISVCLFQIWLHQFHIHQILEFVIAIFLGITIYFWLTYVKYGSIKELIKELRT